MQPTQTTIKKLPTLKNIPNNNISKYNNSNIVPTSSNPSKNIKISKINITSSPQQPNINYTNPSNSTSPKNININISNSNYRKTSHLNDNFNFDNIMDNKNSPTPLKSLIHEFYNKTSSNIENSQHNVTLKSHRYYKKPIKPIQMSPSKFNSQYKEVPLILHTDMIVKVPFQTNLSNSKDNRNLSISPTPAKINSQCKEVPLTLHTHKLSKVPFETNLSNSKDSNNLFISPNTAIHTGSRKFSENTLLNEPKSLKQDEVETNKTYNDKFKKFGTTSNDVELTKLDIRKDKSLNDNIIIENIFLNLSNTTLPEDIKNLLSQGYHETVKKPKNEKIEKTDIEYALRLIIKKETNENPNLLNLNHYQRHDIQLIKNEAYKSFHQRTKHNLTNSQIKKTKKFLTDNNLFLITADKSKTLVLLEFEVYRNLMEIGLENNNFISIKDNLNLSKERKMQALFRKLEQEKAISGRQYHDMYPSGCRCPKIFGKIKLHKNPISIRPIVDGSSAYYSKISKWLGKLLNKYVYKTHSIKNSVELKKQLIDIQLQENDFMFSLDIKNMYSFLPKDKIIKYFLHRYKLDPDKNPKITLDLLDQLLSACTSNICVEFESKFYTQTIGLPMGGTLSPIFGEVALYLLENKLHKNKSLKIKYQCHFADDLFFIVNDEKNAERTLEFINSISDDLEFTLEKEDQNKLNYLDITITRNENSLEFQVYRKETSNYSRIKFNSLHPYHVKINILQQELIRAFKISSTYELLNNEIKLIKKIYLANGYPHLIIDKHTDLINSRAISSYNTIPKNIDNTKRYFPIQVSNLEVKRFLDRHLLSLLKSNNWKNLSEIKFYVAPPITIFQALRTNTQNEDAHLHMQSVVYSATCLSCKSVYIGCTQRNLLLRFPEHLKNSNSAIAMHRALGSQHEFNLSKKTLKVMFTEKNNERLHILEAILILSEEPSLNLNKGMTLISNI